MSGITGIPVARKDWLKEVSKGAETLFRLVVEEQIPEQIVGWMIVVKCLHVLRCVYGSDELALQGLRNYLQERKEREELLEYRYDKVRENA